MIKVIIKNVDGSKEVRELTDGMVIKPEPGQQFYFENLDAKKYKFNLSDGEDSIEILFNKDGQKYKFKFEDMAKLIKESSLLTENKSVLGIINDQEGMDELNQTVLNPEFKSDNIIRELKDLLAQTDGSTNQNGIIIDDFGSLAEQLEAAAAGESTSNGASTFFASEAISGNTYGAEGRGTGLEFNDPDGNLVDVEGTTNNDDETATTTDDPQANEEDIEVSSVTSDTQTEGTSLVHTVTLSGEAEAAKEYDFTFNNGTVED
ncbi:hypothetical protein CRV01_07945, partial [Arcobacter sp. CECT 8983]|uniref:hypothetical protein n=1 Tax=Arcobacter sp. CECT 8983 TaxID=2044508 RepID=UPI001024B7F2